MISDPPENDICEGTFWVHPSAKCTLFEKETCKNYKRYIILSNGHSLHNFKDILGFDVASALIQQGCQLTVFTGTYYFKKYEICISLMEYYNIHIFVQYHYSIVL